MQFATAYENKPTERLTFNDRSLTKQASKEECDINYIVAKYQSTGLLNHVREHAGQYADFDDTDYHEAMNIVADANSMFESVPANIRAKFDNDPGKFLQFVTNPENLSEMVDLGLANPPILEETQPPTVEPKAPQTDD